MARLACLRRVSVIGLGRLGAPLAACFAARGCATAGIDQDPRKVETINRGAAPVFEPGLLDCMRAAGGRLRATTDCAGAVRESDVTFIVVPTPSDDGGAFSLRYVLEAAGCVGEALRQKSDYHLVVVTSTVMPGATDGAVRPLLEARSQKRCGPDFGLCYSPEFIALGTVIRDFLRPDFVLIGESDTRAGQTLAGLYGAVCENDPPVARMSFVNAELTKLALNAYVTTKISFANMLARLCERLAGADVDTVTSALGLDARIGPRYLKGAIGYGGPCFPRDNLALAALARAVGAPATLAEATDAFNRHQVPWLAALVQRHLPEAGLAGILGLAYKPGSDVVEESQGLLLAHALAREGVPVVAFDPVAGENVFPALPENSALASSAEECVYFADVVVVATPWEEFRRLKPAQLRRQGRPRVVIDCWRLFRSYQLDAGVQYIPLGLGHGEDLTA